MDKYVPIWAVFEGTNFNVTGANTSWTPYDLTSRYRSDNGARDWYDNISCETFECARKCTNEFVAPKVPYVIGSIPQVDDCVKACPGYGPWNPRQCVTENADVDVLPTTTTSTAASGSTSTQGANPQSSTARSDVNAGRRSKEVSMVLLLSLLVAVSAA